MDNLAMWAGIVGFIQPQILAIINQPGWDSRLKSAVTFAFCLVTGALTAYFAGSFTGQDIVTSILIVFGASITSYYGLYKPRGITDAIEQATSPTPKIHKESREG